MSSYHDVVKRFLADVNKFINVTLQSEILSIPAVRERNRLTEALQKLFGDYDSLAPSSGDEGSASSAKDLNPNDESRNTLDSSHGSEEDSYADNIPDSTVKALTNPIKIGYLERKQKDLLFSSWQKRYCVLYKNILYIFKKPGDKKQQGAFFVTGYELREAPQNVKDAAKKECSFELVCPGKKTHQFVTENKDDLRAWKVAIDSVSSQSSSVDANEAETGEDLYEPLDEVAGPCLGISVSPPTPSPFGVEEEPDELYDEATSLGQKTSGPPKTIPVSPLNKTPAVVPVVIKVDQNQNEKAVDDFEDDNMIYEPIDIDMPPGRQPNQANDLPSPDAAPPPLPPHVSKQVDSTPNLPPPPPPKHDDPAPPPALPNRSGLPPPPSEPLPAIPQTPKKKTTPTLGKILTPSEDFENMFYGMWNCTSNSEDELSFKQGEIVHVISRDLEKDDWWIGELHGKIGLVPKSYLTPAYELVP